MLLVYRWATCVASVSFNRFVIKYFIACNPGSCATTLLAPPYSLTSTLASPFLLSPKTDLKLKHSVLGLLKNLIQSAGPSPTIQDALSRNGVIWQLQESGVWNERSDRMADIVQLNAIGVVRHLCSIDSTYSIYTSITFIYSRLQQLLQLNIHLP